MNNEITNLDASAFKQSAAPRLIKGTVGARLINPGAPGVSLSPGAPGRLIDQSKRAAFTLIEMLVSLSILIILMAAVGEIFSLAGRTVRVGQATLTAMSSIRAVESQIANDVKHLDTNGFLIIRQRQYAPYWQTGVQYEPGDEVEVNSAGTIGFYLCQQANTTQTGITTGASVPVPGAGGTGTIDWLLLTGAVGQYPIWRADQIGFMETGNFHGRTGSTAAAGYGNTFSSTGLSSYLTSNKAIVWYGQLVADNGTAGANYTPSGYSPPTLIQEEKPYMPQFAFVRLGTPPSGQTSGQFYFGREAMLLLPAGSTYLFNSNLYTNPFYDPASYGTKSDASGINFAAVSPPETPVTITSSRLDAAFDALPTATYKLATPAPSSQTLVAPVGPGTIEGYVNSLPLSTTSLYDVANFFDNRFAAIVSPSASRVISAGTSAQALNGYFRMTPIMLQGVPSFSVDWTDGSYNSPKGTNNGQAVSTTALDWFGLDGNTSASVVTVPATAGTYGPLFSYSAGALTLPNNEAVLGNSSYPGTTTPDGVTYVFYAGNKAAWPKALKITYAVTDPNNRLQGGRFVTQVVNLPQ